MFLKVMLATSATIEQYIAELQLSYLADLLG
jgi:hypothetical protein